jgi:GntR family transcriptional repressor for pyruvate dehydrogenase complex
MAQNVRGFEKIRTTKKPSMVAEQILSAIREGRYKKGDKLPSESEIAEAVGVSRSSVREAISALAIVGVLESKAGQGTYVLREPANTSLEGEVMNLLEKSESPFDVLEARKAFEVAILELVIARRTDEDIASLQSALSQMQRAFELRSHDELSKANLSFHLCIGKASKNKTIEKELRQLLSVGEQSLWKEMISQSYSWEATVDLLIESWQIHRGIFEAIRDKDKERAVREMTRHFDFVVATLEKDLAK